MNKYLIRFAQYHEDFRLPELIALAKLEGIDLDLDDINYNKLNPFLIIELKSDEEAKKLIKRSILVKSVYNLWAQAQNYEQLHKEVKATSNLWAEYKQASFKFQVITYGKSRDISSQVSIINEFSYMDLQGKIDLKNPEQIFCILEDFSPNTLGGLPSETVKNLYFGRYLGDSSREIVNIYDLKKRQYLGTTSMDAELSLIMANMALIKKDDLVYDPFVGTGSFLVTSAHFGAYTLGSDIDGRQVRGKGGKSIRSNVEQYNLSSQILDTVVFDITRHAWRNRPFFNAIITDPPYGVRAGARKLGRKGGNRNLEDIQMIYGVEAHLNKDYIPPKVQYDMPQVLADLLSFGATYLLLNGRLVFWLPNIVEEGEEPEVPQHPCLQLIADSEQVFNGWSRRLITMEKIKEPDTPFITKNIDVDQENLFRVRYFQPNN